MWKGLKQDGKGLSELIAKMLFIPGVLLSGCTSVFFYPDQDTYATPQMLGTPVEDVTLSNGAETLHGWWLPAAEPKGSVFYLHGNAQNLSSHVINVSWLPSEGYNVFIFDYRGYGKSSGTPDLNGVLNDSRIAWQWFTEKTPPPNRYILGQSLGAALAIRLTAGSDLQRNACGLITDAAFDSFPGIVREKLADVWLTWPFQYPLSWLIPGQDNPIDFIDRIYLPLMIIHSQRDEVIPYHHGERLYTKANTPKQFLATQTPHTATFAVPEHRKAMLTFMQSCKTSLTPSAEMTSVSGEVF